MCGQHALNNLIQSSFFDAGILSGIASELDGVEEAMMGKSNENSANVDDQGNFSIQVIKVGLERFKNIELELWHHRKGIQDIDPLKQTGFIIHSSDHWFTIRKINGKWWNLNSILAAPAPITDFFLRYNHNSNSSFNPKLNPSPNPTRIYISIHLCFYLSSIYISIYLSIYPSMYVSIYLYIYVCMYVCMYLSIHLSIYLSIYLSTHLSIYLSIHLSIHPSDFSLVRF